MPYTLQYTAKLVHTTGETYTFTGSQQIATDSPASSDFTTAGTAIGSEIATQMTSKFPTQQADDSPVDSSGGEG